MSDQNPWKRTRSLSISKVEVEMDKEVKSARKMAMLAESCWSCHMRRVLVVAALDAAYLPFPFSFPLFIPSVWQVAAMLGQVACLGSLFGSSSTCHRSHLHPPPSSLLTLQAKYICQWCWACNGALHCAALFVLILWHSYKVCLRICAAQYVIAWTRAEAVLRGEAGGVAVAATTLNGNVRSSKHTHTCTSLAHSHNCGEACSIDWDKLKNEIAFYIIIYLFIYLIYFIQTLFMADLFLFN